MDLLSYNQAFNSMNTLNQEMRYSVKIQLSLVTTCQEEKTRNQN